MTNSKRKCKFCKKYTPEFVKFPVGTFCSVEHAMAFGKEKAAKDRQKQARKQIREDKKRIKPMSKWLSELQALVNKCVRLRDANLGCVSCDKPSVWGGQWHASHYFSRGHSSALRFNMWNIHKSCSICNAHLSGNIEQYTHRLIEKIGQDRYELLVKHKSDIRKYDQAWVERAIKVARKAVKRYERKLHSPYPHK